MPLPDNGKEVQNPCKKKTGIVKAAAAYALTK